MNLAVKTLGRLFLDRIESSSNNNAIGWIENDILKFYTFEQYKNIVESISLALIKNGLKKQDKVCILANTCKEWHLMDLGILCAGAVTVPIYPTYLEHEVKFIIEHSDASIIIIENDEQFSKLAKNLNQLESLKMVISLIELNEDNKKKVRNFIPLYSFKELKELGNSEKSHNPDLFKDRILNTSDQDLASIIYTSGTTGEPKGAILTHGAIVQMLFNVSKFTHNAFTEKDRTLTFLPLSHVFGRAETMLPILFGLECVYAESIEKILDNIQIVKPTLLMAVPRIFEKIYSKVHDQINNSSLITQKLFNWAVESGRSYFDTINSDKAPSSKQLLQYQLAYKLVFKKIYEKFGGKIRYFISGGAPLSSEIIKFLRSANLTILEGYGLTETVAPCTLNPLSKQIPGTVGQPIGDVELKFASDGEILIKSKALFSGYYKNDEATEAVLKDGWFASGDIGHFTTDGYLKITDRKKDIIITSGGKNIAPQKIENLMKNQSLISHFCVYGDKQKYLVALVGIEKESFNAQFEKLGLDEDCSFEELAKNTNVYNAVKSQIDATNQGLAQFETIKKFYIVPEELSTQNYLTPSLKLKKKLLVQAYQNEINAMYES